MLNIKKSLVATVVALVCSGSFAHSTPDQSGVCYTFNGDKLTSKASCIISSGGGAGGMYTSLDFKGKTYSFESSSDRNGNEVWSDNKGQVKSYVRDGTFYKKVSESDAQYVDHLLYCFRSSKSKLDICHN